MYCILVENSSVIAHWALKFQTFLVEHAPKPTPPTLKKGTSNTLLTQLVTLFKPAGYITSPCYYGLIKHKEQQHSFLWHFSEMTRGENIGLPTLHSTDKPLDMKADG